MKAPLTIKDLVNLLYQNKEVIEMLFGNKDSINKSKILAREDMTDEKLAKLVMYEIIHENNNIIGLDDRITTFIEEFLEIGEVTTSFITDNIQALTENLKYYHIDSNPKFLRNIKRSLKKINSTTSREVMKLHKNIDDTYKNQDNYMIKLEELDKYKRKRDDIINLIKESEQIVTEAQGFFNTIIDAELNSIVLDLRYVLVRNRDYLNEIQSQIIDYINRIQYQAEIYKKIQRLKELKDYEELKYKTNFVEVVVNTKALMFQKRNPLKSKLSLDFLHSDRGYLLTQKVAAKLHLLRNNLRKPAGRMAAGFDDNNREESASLNIALLVEKFLQSDTDLFQFVLGYKFPDKVGELSLEKRISLYVGISIDYDPKLLISGKVGKMDYVNDKKQKLKLGYAIIKPNKKAAEAESLKRKSESEKQKVELVAEESVVETENSEVKSEVVTEVDGKAKDGKKRKTEGVKLKAESEEQTVEVVAEESVVKTENSEAKPKVVTEVNDKAKDGKKRKAEGVKLKVEIEEQIAEVVAEESVVKTENSEVKPEVVTEVNGKAKDGKKLKAGGIKQEQKKEIIAVNGKKRKAESVKQKVKNKAPVEDKDKKEVVKLKTKSGTRKVNAEKN